MRGRSGDEQGAERVHRVLLGGAIAISAHPHVVSVTREPRGLALAAARLEHDARRGLCGDADVVGLGGCSPVLLAALGASGLSDGVRAERVGGELAGGGVRRHAENISRARLGRQGAIAVLLKLAL